jgi:prevent-host-death family protein
MAPGGFFKGHTDQLSPMRPKFHLNEVSALRFITVSELRAHATAIVAEIRRKKEDVTVTKNGKPVVLIRAVEEREFVLKSGPRGGKRGKSEV